MKKLNLTLAALGAVALSAVAFADYSPQLRTREKTDFAKSGFTAALDKAEAPRKAAPAKIAAGQGGSNINFTDKIGTLHLAVEEDFSLLTQGTETEPDMMVDLTVDAMTLFDNAWWTFNDQYTQTPHWGCYECYPAGGSLYFKSDERDGAAGFVTPLLDLNKYGDGIGVLEFRAKTLPAGSVTQAIRITAVETNTPDLNVMGKDWDFLEDVYIEDIPDEWTTYRVLLTGCGHSTMFNISAMFPGGFLLDDVKIYELEPFVNRPVALAHSDYEGTSFVANWTPVEGADHYLLSVYSRDEEGFIQYLLKEEKVNGTSSKVTNAVSGEIYWYQVFAVKGEHASLASDAARVYALVAPEFTEVEKSGDWQYTAEWGAVPGAEVYNYMAYDVREATEDGTFVVTDENFDGITDGDGYRTGISKDDPSFEVYELFYPTTLRQQGWKMENGYPYDDYIAVDAFQYLYNDQNAGFISPELDLSKNNGKFTLSVDLAGEETGPYYDESDVKFEHEIYVSTQACVALFNWNDEKGDYDQVELVYPDNDGGKDPYPVKFDWKTFTFDLTKGSTRSKVGVFGTVCPANLYIDNLKITQEYKKGESLMEPFLFDHFHGRAQGSVPTQITVDVPLHASNKKLYHKVSAYSHVADERTQTYDKRESPYSNLEFIGETPEHVGVGNVTLQAGSWTVEDGKLLISNPTGAKVTVSDLNGVNHYQGNALTKTLPLARGIYVIRIGKQTGKAVIK